MLKNKLLTLGLFLTTFAAQAQNVGIGTASPHSSAKLDITANDRGILIPRISIPNLSAAAPITAPATSLLVYNTNAATGLGFYFWNGSQWTQLQDQSNGDHDWYKAGTTTAPTSINDNVFTQGRVGIGLNNPSAVLDMIGDMTINKNQISGGYRPWMVNGISIGASGSDNAYFGLKDEGANRADAVVAWGDDIGDNLRFIHTRSGGAANGLEYMRITSAGRVGIGTTTPAAPLEIASPDFDMLVLNRLHANQDPAILFKGQGVQTWRLIGGDASGSGNADFKFRNAADVEVMRLTESRNIGIGTMNPTAKLHLRSAMNNPLIIQTNTSAKEVATTRNYISLTDNANTPYGYIGDASSDKQINLVGHYAYSVILASFASNTNASHRAGLSINHFDQASIEFRTKGTTVGIIDSTGNMGIGTIVPKDRLHLYSNTATRMIIEGDQQGFINAGLVLKARESSNARGLGVFMHDKGSQTEWFAGRPYSGSDVYVIQRKNALVDHSDATAGLINGSGVATGTERFLTVKNDGKVGIGTTNPISTFQVNEGPTMTAGYSRIATFYAHHPVIQLKGISNTNHSGFIGYDAQANVEAMRFWTGRPNNDIGTSASNAMSIYATGNVRIGSGIFSPNVKLEVCGNTKIVGQIQANSSSLSAGLTCSSDERLKKNINTYTDAAATINKLTGKQYFWKTEEFKDRGFDERLKYGFIAQEVEKVLPNLVYTDDKGFKSVDYIQVIPILTNAIKEQQKELELQKMKNEELMHVLKDMELRLQALEQK